MYLVVIKIIDYENLIFTAVANALRARYPEWFVTPLVNTRGIITGDIAPIPSSFPAVAIEEIDNSTHTRTLDTSRKENHAVILYQVEHYSNRATGRKSQCKELRAVVDDVMQNFGFRRLSTPPTPQPSPTIYRLTARYQAIVSNDGKVYKGR